MHDNTVTLTAEDVIPDAPLPWSDFGNAMSTTLAEGSFDAIAPDAMLPIAVMCAQCDGLEALKNHLTQEQLHILNNALLASLTKQGYMRGAPKSALVQ